MIDSVFSMSKPLTTRTLTVAGSLLLLLVGILSPGTLWAQITVFSECNYQGTAISLKRGIYDASALRRAGVADNSISSIVVSDGFTTTLYADDRFDGTTGTLKKSSKCLQRGKFNDQISSLTVQKQGNEKLALKAVRERYPRSEVPAGVTFYGFCDYRGKAVTLPAGDYRLSDLLEAGIKNNDISSLKVPRGYTVTAYANDFLRGDSFELPHNDNCLADDGFDEEITSLSIRVDQRLVANTSQGTEGGYLNSQSGSTSTPQTVIAYSDCNYRGAAVELPAGEYSESDLLQRGMRNNAISSLRVPEGFSVAVYENNFFRGNGALVETDVACLDGRALNDAISSIVVEGAAVNAAQNTTGSGNTSGLNDSAAVVSLYSKCGYEGNRASVPVGEYNAQQLQQLGIGDNTLSALRVNQGYEVELFFFDFFRGKSGILRADDSCLSNDGFDNEVSSIRVKRTGVAGNTSTNTNSSSTNSIAANDSDFAATVYGQCDFSGGKVSLQPGRYTQTQLAELGIGNDAVASLRVKPGFTMVLYDNGQHRGRGIPFTSDDDCLDDNNLLRRVSSLVIGQTPKRGGSSNTSNSTLGNTGGSLSSGTASSAAVVRGLNCVSLYVERNICEARRWDAISNRCKLDQIPNMSDGYLEGHVLAGNCTAANWPTLRERISNPSLR